MLNNTQRQELEAFFGFYGDDICSAPAAIAERALVAIFEEHSTYEQSKPKFRKVLVLESISVLRRVLAHPCPQNRYSG